MLRFAWVAVLGIAGFATGCKKNPPQPLRVAAAADLARAFSEVTPAFSARYPFELKLTLGSTGLLARQIAEGAPFDLFLAADRAYADQVVKSGACDGATEDGYARGRIVIWVKGDGGGALSLASLADARFKHIAIATPEHAPYGAAAKEALSKAGVWAQVSQRMVYGENVQQTLELAQSGNADAAIVGLSLAIGSVGGSWAMIDEATYSPIEQSLVVCRHGTNRVGGQKLADFLKSPAGQVVLRKYGFLLPGEEPLKAP
ncbi:MAG: molybdate ABC transporter substrate-binding protein [Pseudomonadota bacterium]